jgi:hypothetical protein
MPRDVNGQGQVRMPGRKSKAAELDTLMSNNGHLLWSGIVEKSKAKAVVHLIRGLDPIREHLVVDPALPNGIGMLGLLDIPGRWGHVDAFGRGRIGIERALANT